MKKFVTIFIALAVLLAVPLLHKYVLFDHEPFDDLRVGEIEKVYLFTDGNTNHDEIFDYSAFADRIEDLELVKRTNEVNYENQGRVKATIYYRDGREQRVSVSPNYVQTDDGIYISNREENIEFLKYAFRNTLFAEDMSKGVNEQRMDEILMLAINGKTWDEIRDYAKDKLLTSGFPDEKLRSFANNGYSPIDIYVLDSDTLFQLTNSIMSNVWKANYKDLVQKVWLDYKIGNIRPDEKFAAVPADFQFTESIDWDNISFSQSEMGYLGTKIPSADGKYFMTFSINDFTYGHMDGSVTDNPPFVEYTGFYLQSDFK